MFDEEDELLLVEDYFLSGAAYEDSEAVMTIWSTIMPSECLTLLAFLREGRKQMHTYDIYYEPADTDDPRIPLGTIQAESISDALDKAAQWFEYDSADLVAVFVVKEEE